MEASQEVLFAKTLEQIRKQAKEQGNCIEREQVEQAFVSLSLSKEQLYLPWRAKRRRRRNSLISIFPR